MALSRLQPHHAVIFLSTDCLYPYAVVVAEDGSSHSEPVLYSIALMDHSRLAPATHFGPGMAGNALLDAGSFKTYYVIVAEIPLIFSVVDSMGRLHNDDKRAETIANYLFQNFV